MTFQYQHNYITVKGSLGNGAEHWQFGLRALNQQAADLWDNQAIALQLAPVIEAWWRGTGYDATNKFDPMDNCKLEEVKVSAIGLDGKYIPGTVSYSHFYLPAIAGTYVTWTGWIPQATICATLTTGVPRGLASHGRIYLPPSGNMATQNSGVMTAASALHFANNVKKLINDINPLTTVGPVMVMSKGHGVKVDVPTKKRWEWTYPNPGTSAAVTGCRVGTVIDTQRRRRRGLLENPQAVQLA